MSICAPQSSRGDGINSDSSAFDFCAAETASESEYEGTDSEPGSEPESDPEDENEHDSEEGPRLTGVRRLPSTEGKSRHDRLTFNHEQA